MDEPTASSNSIWLEKIKKSKRKNSFTVRKVEGMLPMFHPMAKALLSSSEGTDRWQAPT